MLFIRLSYERPSLLNGRPNLMITKSMDFYGIKVNIHKTTKSADFGQQFADFRQV